MAAPDPASSTRRAEAVERLHEQLQESLRTLITSEDWQQALAVAARFHNYSFANTQLIWSQAIARGFQPSHVAGYRTWQKVGRQVRRGERGLAILAPVTRKLELEDGEDERRVVGFRPVHVFDISQTDGEPLPQVRTALIEGDLPVQWDQIAELIAKAGFSMQVADVDRLGDANGITDWNSREVVVRASLPGAQRFKTAVHELAHINLHEPNSQGRPNCRGIVEVEAESVAYMVCAGLGVDSAGYSLPYVASWSGGDLDKVTATADRVIRCAHHVLTDLEAEPELVRGEVSRGIAKHHGRAEMKEKRAPDLLPEEARREQRHPQLADALRAAVAFYQTQLDQDGARDARGFLQQRGFNDSTASHWQLGYAPAAWDTLVSHLRGQGVSDDVLLEAGLAGRARTGRLYDRMRERIVFPIFDAEGEPRGFAGRLLSGDGPKYLNSPETPLYKKATLLYGLHKAEEAIAETGQVVVVEGYTDAIAAHQAGITNAVATGGTALTAHHIHALRPGASVLTLAFDGDQAGLQAALRVAELPGSVTSGLSIRVAHLPEASDPGDLLSAGRWDLVQDALDRSVPLAQHQIDQVVAKYNLNEPEALVRAIYAAQGVIARIESPLDRTQAVSHLAKRVGRSTDLVQLALQASSHARGGRWADRERGRALT